MTIKEGDVVKIADDFTPRAAGKLCKVTNIFDEETEYLQATAEVELADSGDICWVPIKYLEQTFQYAAHIYTSSSMRAKFQIRARNKQEATTEAFNELNGAAKRTIGHQTFLLLDNKWINTTCITSITITKEYMT